MVKNISFTNLDFFDNKNALKEYLRAQDRFKDYDFEGSNLSVLLDVLSYNTFLNNYYVHAAFSEMFLDTAQLRENLNSHAKELNYLPQSRQSSTALVDIIINVPTGLLTPPTFLTIPRNTMFVGKCNGQTFTFFSDKSVTVYPDNGVYRYYGLKIYEGNVLTESYVVNNSSPQRYAINSDICDTDSVKVFVRDNIQADSDTYEYMYKPDVYGITEEDKVFYLQPHYAYKYEVYFGRNVLGLEPTQGNIITIEYRTTVGEEANGVKYFSPATTIAGYSAECITVQMSEAGTERESNEDIRYFAPKYAQVQQRSVTETDYGILLKNQFSEIQEVAVYGGEKADPPMYGRVVIAVDIENADGVTLAEARKFTDFLKDRVPLAIEPMIVPAQFMYIDVVTSVTYNTASTSKSSGEIVQTVNDSIIKYSDDELNRFGETVRFSKLVNYIDESDLNIVSNDSKIRAIIEYVPSLLSAETFDINFRNALNYDHGIYKNDIHYPGVVTSTFTYKNLSCYMVDDGQGIVKIVYDTDTGLEIIEKNIGTVDYSTGKVNIVRFLPTAYSGNAIKFYANPKTLDIICPEERIVKIRKEDMLISVKSIRT
jgi:hypothetical protein